MSKKSSTFAPAKGASAIAADTSSVKIGYIKGVYCPIATSLKLRNFRAK